MYMRITLTKIANTKAGIRQTKAKIFPKERQVVSITADIIKPIMGRRSRDRCLGSMYNACGCVVITVAFVYME